MRILILSFLLCCAAQAADTSTNADPYAPHAFESAAAMDKWATSTFGGAKTQEFTHKERKLVVYFRCYTSGVPTSEPVVFVEKAGRWIQVLSAMSCPFEMEASIERDALVLWRLESQKGKRKKTEFLRFTLANLDAA
jgi:hypothetical protein